MLVQEGSDVGAFAGHQETVSTWKASWAVHFGARSKVDSIRSLHKLLGLHGLATVL